MRTATRLAITAATTAITTILIKAPRWITVRETTSDPWAERSGRAEVVTDRANGFGRGVASGQGEVEKGMATADDAEHEHHGRPYVGLTDLPHEARVERSRDPPDEPGSRGLGRQRARHERSLRRRDPRHGRLRQRPHRRRVRSRRTRRDERQHDAREPHQPP